VKIKHLTLPDFVKAGIFFAKDFSPLMEPIPGLKLQDLAKRSWKESSNTLMIRTQKLMFIG